MKGLEATPAEGGKPLEEGESQDMNRIITPEILVAYSQCPRKAFLLLCTHEQGTTHEYVRILEQQGRANRSEYIALLRQKNSDVQPYSVDHLNNGSGVLINATLKADGLEADCAVLTKVKGSSSLGRYSYQPTIVVGTHSISKTDKLRLFFVGYVLQQIQSKPPEMGIIIGMGTKSHKVKLDNNRKTLVPFLEPLQEWTSTSSPEQPPLVLNKHCALCPFEALCRAKAEQEDNLSLLDGVTAKVVRRYEKKGIFTVKQLSYLYKPRKRRKDSKKPPQAIHKIELQALAIRTGKIYLEELPELSRQPVELFLDIEGIPDQQAYYLIGLLVCEGDTSAYHSFWADTLQDEVRMWRQFLEKMNEYPNAPIYHYGSYEPRALAKLVRRYKTDSDGFKDRLVNVNSYIHGKVYFPLRSNQLKEIGKFIGASWTSPNASGLQSLVWRHYWDETGNAEYRGLLLTYNAEDCQALKLLIEELSKIRVSADTLPEVDFVNRPKMQGTEIGEQVHSQFKAVIESASLQYEGKKISFRQPKRREDKEGKKERNRRGAQALHQKLIDTKRKVTKVTQVPQEEVCPKCGNESLRPTERVSERLTVDLVLTKNGIKRTTTEYRGSYVCCPKCAKCSPPPSTRAHDSMQLYGHGFKAWIAYNRVGLRLPYKSILELLEEHFNERVSVDTVPRSIERLAKYYEETEQIITRYLLKRPFVHADETKINIQGVNWYVWVFTNGEYVVFKLRETREATVVHEFLTDYNGILVSDFYPGYDSVQCRQQKCWVHLIRDLNNDLRDTPFDTEFEAFILEVRNLIIPIMEAIQRYGLKKRNLNRFRKEVDRFYQKVIVDKQYKSDLVLKYQKRFIRYRDSLFTFLGQDGIPWHNNAAERAIRHLAIQRDMSTPFHESTMHSYLVLLGIRQTCRFQGKSFFKFLFSGEKDIDQFEARKRRKSKRSW